MLPKNGITNNLALEGFGDIFQSTIDTAVDADESKMGESNASGENIVQIPLGELHPPEFHPFHVNDDDAMGAC